MAFSIAHFNAGQLQWMPVLSADIVYVGCLVKNDTDTPVEGISPLLAASGANNTTLLDVPLGVVVAVNATSGNEEISTTYKTQQITQVAAGAVYGATKEYQPIEGEYPIGDRQAYALVHRIGPETVIRGDIFNAAVGTAPTEVTVTVASGGDGIGCTTTASDVATVANFATIYVRSGANKGIYRTLTSASTTVHTWLKAMPSDMAIGDKAVIVNGLRPYGLCRMQIEATEGNYINCAADITGPNYFIVDVRRLDLSTAGNEYVEFTFTADNFCATRA